MTRDDLIDRVRVIMEAIRDAERCEDFSLERGSECDGLQGCKRCLENAADAIVALAVW